MYILQLTQGERTHSIGLFASEKEVEAWLGTVPFITREEEHWEGTTFVTYTLSYETMPLYAEVEWNGSIVPLTRYMFEPELPIYVEYYPLPVMGEVKGLVQGGTQVDAYVVDNEEVKSYVFSREAARHAIVHHYEAQGKDVFVGGVGSEDGEYVSVDGGPFVHLDAMTVQAWEEKESEEAFLQALDE